METIAELLNTATSTTTKLTVFEISGLLGVAVYVSIYAALQLGQIDGNSLRYTLLNGTAASLVLISLWQDFNLASALIQITWISISVVGICRIAIRQRRASATPSLSDALAEYRALQSRAH